WGQQRSMEKGVVFGHTILGYKIKNGTLEIDPIKAETVRVIFHKYLNEAKGLSTIARELENTGTLTSYGRKRWDATSVQRILTNEKYCGDLKQKKFITPNYLTHQTKRNKGEEELVIIKDNHEAIISRGIFDKVQAEMVKRGVKNNEGTRHTRRYPFSGKLQCALCDSTFISRNRNRNNGKGQIRRWQCSRYFKYGAMQNDKNGCENTMVRNEILEHVFRLALQDSVHNKDKIIKDCIRLVSSTLNADQIQSDYHDAERELERLTNRLSNLVNLRLDGEITKEELKSMREPLDIQVATARNKLKQLEKNTALADKQDTLLDKIKDRITNLVYADIFSDEVVKERLDKIVVYGKSRFDVYLKGDVVNFTSAA
ncbi:MAG: recombinase family protein, partial [Defluviitaleaceae bacterium]|nr:recombinase family protein [Defluviitaleaceae bacterium]